MRIFQKKRCLNCAFPYIPKGSSSKFCTIACREEFRKLDNKIRHHAWAIRTGKFTGVGKGGAPHSGKDNPMWKGGVVLVQERKHTIKKEVRFCEKCGKDLIKATHYQWVIHHKDRNRTHNDDDFNLQLLCKSCHQIEHKCWEAFEGATTMAKASTG